MRCRALIFLTILCCASPLYASTKVQVITEGAKTAWLVEDHTLPIVTVKMLFEHSGSAYDPKDKEGLASMVSDMLDEGAGDMDSLAFHHALENHAIRFDAESSEDSILLSLQTLSEFKDAALQLFDLAINDPRFDEDAVERIRAATLSELRELASNPSYLASLNWKKIAFAGHPYGHARLGSEASIAAIKREDLLSFTAQHLDCNKRVIAVVGDITPVEVKRWLSASSSHHHSCADQEVKIADVTVVDGGDAPTIVKKDVPQTVVQASLPSVARSDPRYYAVYVLNYILGGNSLTSRLGKEIRDKRGLAYYAESEMQAFDHCPYILMQFATRDQKAMAAFGVFKEQLSALEKGGITEAELDDAKKYITGSFPLQIDSENALADHLISMQHYHLGIDYLEKRNNLVEAVTLKQVNDAAKMIFAHSPLVVMVGDPEDKPIEGKTGK